MEICARRNNLIQPVGLALLHLAPKNSQKSFHLCCPKEKLKPVYSNPDNYHAFLNTYKK